MVSAVAWLVFGRVEIKIFGGANLLLEISNRLAAKRSKVLIPFKLSSVLSWLSEIRLKRVDLFPQLFYFFLLNFFVNRDI